jgi:hypothetical protein
VINIHFNVLILHIRKLYQSGKKLTEAIKPSSGGRFPSKQ